MRNRFLTPTSLLIVTLILTLSSSQWLAGQTVYPVQGQPQGGDRRETEAAFIEWDRKIIHVFADSGLCILSSPVLGEPVLGPLKPERWNMEGFNEGAP